MKSKTCRCGTKNTCFGCKSCHLVKMRSNRNRICQKMLVRPWTNTRGETKLFVERSQRQIVCASWSWLIRLPNSAPVVVRSRTICWDDYFFRNTQDWDWIWKRPPPPLAIFFSNKNKLHQKCLFSGSTNETLPSSQLPYHNGSEEAQVRKPLSRCLVMNSFPSGFNFCVIFYFSAILWVCMQRMSPTEYSCVTFDLFGACLRKTWRREKNLFLLTNFKWHPGDTHDTVSRCHFVQIMQRNNWHEAWQFFEAVETCTMHQCLFLLPRMGSRFTSHPDALRFHCQANPHDFRMHAWCDRGLRPQLQDLVRLVGHHNLSPALRWRNKGKHSFHALVHLLLKTGIFSSCPNNFCCAYNYRGCTHSGDLMDSLCLKIQNYAVPPVWFILCRKQQDSMVRRCVHVCFSSEKLAWNWKQRRRANNSCQWGWMCFYQLSVFSAR